MSGHTEREALLKYLDIFLHSNPKVDLSGIVCKHGLAIEACASRECSNPMAYETAIKCARDYIAADSHAELVKALENLDSVLDFNDENLEPVWTFDDLTAVRAAFKQATAALATLTPRKVG